MHLGHHHMSWQDWYIKKASHNFLYFAEYDVHFFAQISEGKIRMYIIYGYTNSIPIYVFNSFIYAYALEVLL